MNAFMSKWGLLAALLLAAVGVGLLAPGPAMHGRQAAAAGTIAAVACLVLAAAAFVCWAVAGLRKRAAARRLTGYACRQCGYTPDLKDVKAGVAFPCPTCGQLMHQKL